MAITVKELIEKLQGYPADSVIAIEDLASDQEFIIVSFSPGDTGENKLTILISDELEEDKEG